ncbi:MAG: LemA family protein [Gemmatimonadales bacterium]|nr:LemA family protein [Gemmatimonadales bacterium]
MGYLVVALVVVAGFVIFTYNGLARLRLLADNAWADIDVQLKRRHDLIPTLVASVTGHAGYERQTLEAIVEARNRATAASGPRQSGEAEGALAAQVRQIFALAEAYPDLRATESFLSLQKNLSEIEDHVQQARRYYNAVVRDLNTRIAQFPANLVAGPFRFSPREFFAIDDGTERAAPRLDFGGR